MERVAGGQIWWVVNKLNSNFAEASIEKKLYTQSYFSIVPNFKFGSFSIISIQNSLLTQVNDKPKKVPRNMADR